MKTSNSIRNLHNGITLLEVVVIVAIIVTVVVLSLPVGHGCGRDGRLTNSLINAKQITAALRLYAEDHGGKFPSTRPDGVTALVPGDSSNRAFQHLLRTLSGNKKVFLNKDSAWCRNPAADTTETDLSTLRRGQNDWNYITGLSNNSDSRWPLISTATASASNLTYSNSTAAKGGVWKGAAVIIGYPDGSAKHLAGSEIDLTDKTRTFPKRPDNGKNMLIPTSDWLGDESFVLVPE